MNCELLGLNICTKANMPKLDKNIYAIRRLVKPRTKIPGKIRQPLVSVTLDVDGEINPRTCRVPV